MKKIILFVLMFITIQINAQDKKMEIIQNSISEIKEKFAPDKRVAIFNIEIKQDENSIQLVGETTELNAKIELLKRLEDENIVYSDNIKVLPESDLGNKTLGLIDVSVANLRG